MKLTLENVVKIHDRTSDAFTQRICDEVLYGWEKRSHGEAIRFLISLVEGDADYIIKKLYFDEFGAAYFYTTHPGSAEYWINKNYEFKNVRKGNAKRPALLDNAKMTAYITQLAAKNLIMFFDEEDEVIDYLIDHKEVKYGKYM